MRSDAILIVRPAIDFNAFLGISHEALGYSPAKAVDASPVEHSDESRFLACLAALGNPDATAILSPHLLCHVSFSAFVAAEEQDMLEILQVCSGMSFVIADTRARGVQIAVISGSLAQWRDAVKSGSHPDRGSAVRNCFNRLMGQFEKAGLAAAWKDFVARSMPDRTFYLENKRK